MQRLLKKRRTGRRGMAVMTMALLVGLMAGCGQKSAAPAATAPPAAGGQPAAPGPQTAEQLAAYKGADWEKVMIEQAKKEGQLTFYTTMRIQDYEEFFKAFKAKYPDLKDLKIQGWRSNIPEVTDRVIAEHKAGRKEFDVVYIGGLHLEKMVAEGALRSYRVPGVDMLPDAARGATDKWYPNKITFYAQAYNTNAVKKENVPKTWDDLNNPKFKDMLAVEISDHDWFGTLAARHGEEKTVALFKSLRGLGMSGYKGATALAEMVAAGQAPIALTVRLDGVLDLQQKGAPIAPLLLEPVIGQTNGAGLATNTQHPAAALLFIDFLFSKEAAQLLIKQQDIPLRKDVDGMPKVVKEAIGDKYILFDNGALLKAGDKWSKIWKEFFISKG